MTQRAERVVKPRTLLWEWLVLGASSPLRRELDHLDDGERFGFLPRLRFVRPRGRRGGAVERVSLAPLGRMTPARRAELATSVGRALALFGWLGVSDLHWENLALGLDATGRVVFSPLDIEAILADLSLPTQTKLLPAADPDYAAVCQHACGVRRVLPYLGKPIRVQDLLRIASAYLELLAFLDQHARSIARVLLDVPDLRAAPIRVCLRGTDEYVRSASEPPDLPLLEAERAQLERGDIPYFFRLYGRPGLYYYADPSLERLARVPRQSELAHLEPLLALSSGLCSPSRQRLAEQGLFTLLGAFDHPSFSGRHEDAGLAVRFGARTLSVELPSGMRLGCPRRLGAVVGSVYLDCRCGEVRSVLVPAVTRCRAPRRRA